MQIVFHRTLTLGCAALLLGCGHKDDVESNGSATVIRTKSDGVQRPMAAGDVRIVAPGQGIDLALLGDTISSGLSPDALGSVRKSTDTTAVKGTGFASSIEKMVKTSVQDAIGTRIGFPLSAVKGARYEGSAIVLDWNGSSKNVFEHTKVNNKPLLTSFSEEDSKRFVDAVNARKRTAK